MVSKYHERMKWYPVRIFLPADGFLQAEIFEDEIKAESKEQAIRNALWNWVDAEKVELIAPRESKTA